MRPVFGPMSATTKAGLIERYADKIVGVLGCYDRVVLNGTLMAIAHPEAMAGVLRREGIRCFDLAQFVEPLREEIRQNAERLAAARHTVRKEDLVAEKLAQRGRQPGLVCIFSAKETCTTYRPWHPFVELDDWSRAQELRRVRGHRAAPETRRVWPALLSAEHAFRGRLSLVGHAGGIRARCGVPPRRGLAPPSTKRSAGTRCSR